MTSMRQLDPQIERVIQNLGDRIQRRLAELGMSQQALADLCGSDRQSVSRWIHGHYSPQFDRLPTLAHALGWPLSKLVEGIDAHMSDGEDARSA